MVIQINEKIFDTFPHLESDRLIYRQFTDDDAQRLYDIRDNEKVMQYMDAYPEPNVESVKHKIQEMNLAFEMKLGINWAMIKKNTAVMIGYFGIWKIDADNCRGEIGYALDPKYWGKGYMSEAFQRLISFGFQKLHLHSLEANINPHNESSGKILLKHGFVKEGYFRENFYFDGKFLDSEVYSLLERDWHSK